VFCFNNVGRRLSKNDVRVVLLSQLLVELCAGRIASEVNIELEQLLPETRLFVNHMWASQDINHQAVQFAELQQATQMALFEPETHSSTL
jgi:putative DNA methylase